MLAAANDELLKPASSSGWLNGQVQTVSVGVPTWLGQADEGGREGLVAVGNRPLMIRQLADRLDCLPAGTDYGWERPPRGGGLRCLLTVRIL